MTTSHDSRGAGDCNEPADVQNENPRAELLRHWEAIRNAPDVTTPDEADALAAEAVAHSRAKE